MIDYFDLARQICVEPRKIIKKEKDRMSNFDEGLKEILREYDSICWTEELLNKCVFQLKETYKRKFNKTEIGEILNVVSLGDLDREGKVKAITVKRLTNAIQKNLEGGKDDLQPSRK